MTTKDHLSDKSERYVSLDSLVNSENYIQTLLAKIQELSKFVKKFKSLSGSEYLIVNQKDYEAQVRLAEEKIKKIFLKLLSFSSKESVEIVENLTNFKPIIEVIDDLLESASNNLDILNGIKHDHDDEEIEEMLAKTKEKLQDQYLQRFKKKQNYRPVDDFDNDNSYFLFIPKIRTKPNQIEELNPEIESAREKRAQNKETFLRIKYSDKKESYRNPKLFEHPYQTEIQVNMANVKRRAELINDSYKKILSRRNVSQYLNKSNEVGEKLKEFSLGNFKEKTVAIESINSDSLKSENSFHQYIFEKIFNDESNEQSLLSEDELLKVLSTQVIKYKDFTTFSSINCSFVNTKELFDKMLEELKDAQEIAVDLEHHSIESYLGFLCLMQISSRTRDYIVDVIEIRDQIHRINEVFTNPKILKVMHGADFDVVWLQKDFGVYLVNVFDTGQAARVLKFPQFSLKYLLKDLLNKDVDKSFQVADWRTRPLQKEMLKYAIEDTHYLLTIYDMLKIQLMKHSIYRSEPILSQFLITYERSNELTLKQYFKPNAKIDSSYYSLIERNALLYNKRQLSIFKILYKFRDYLGRIFDVNPHQIYKDSQIFRIIKLNNDITEKEIRFELKNPELQKYIPELMVVIKEKVDKITKMEVKMKTENLEESYLKTVEKLKARKEGLMKMTFDSNKDKSSAKVKKEEVKTEFKYSDFISLPSVSDLKISVKVSGESSFLHQGENNLKPSSKEESNFDSICESFSNINLIDFLRKKHTGLKIVVKENKKNSREQEEVKGTNSKSKSGKKSKELGIDEEIVADKQPQLTQKKREREVLDLTDLDHLTKRLTKEQELKKTGDDSEENSNNSDEELSNKNKSSINTSKHTTQNPTFNTQSNLKASSAFIEAMFKNKKKK